MGVTAAPQIQPLFRNLLPGDPATWFKQRSTSSPNYAFDTAAGRYVVMCFFGTARDNAGQTAIATVQANRNLFDDQKACFFGVSVDEQDQETGRVSAMLPGLRYFWDFDFSVGQLYGAVSTNGKPGNPLSLRRFWMVLDPMLRVRAVFPFKDDGSDRDEVMAYVQALPPVELFAGFEIPAPVLVIPNVFEPELCRHLIKLYEQHGGEESGFMREVNGKTVGIHDPDHKRRKDYTIDDPGLTQDLQGRIIRRINPEIEKVHFFRPTRMERYIVSCYAAEDGGHFRAHRDNTTKGTAHRRFAVSINLNNEFEGGEVSFPEYGPRSYKAPPGGAVVFSCPLLHAVSKVTRGCRYAFLPFLYDEAAAKIREQNNTFLDESVGFYSSKNTAG
jgi:predicted 2-oxoglutarate/Fe(II)-dependent dioxygenase YbiX/peroxiredoxin